MKHELSAWVRSLLRIAVPMCAVAFTATASAADKAPAKDLVLRGDAKCT